MRSPISGPVRERGRKAKDRLGRAYESWVSIELPVGYDAVRAHVEGSTYTDIEVLEETIMEEGVEEKDPVELLETLTSEGEAVESVEFGYTPKPMGNRIEAEIYCRREEQEYLLQVDAFRPHF